jgi:hypothetical protein
MAQTMHAHKHLTYSIPRDEGYEVGVERCGVPGDTAHLPPVQQVQLLHHLHSVHRSSLSSNRKVEGGIDNATVHLH